MPVSELILKSCPFFSHLPDAVVADVAARMSIIHLKRREVLLPNGQAFRGLGLVFQGRLQAIDYTLDGREVALSTIEANETFGQATLIAPRPVQMTWMAVASTSLAVMPPQLAVELLQGPHMSFRVATELAQQVCDFLNWQKILSVHPVSARVCAWILWSVSDRTEITLPTHAELAWRLSTTRESITRILQRLQNDTILQRSGDLWHVNDRTALEELARGEPAAP